MTFKKGHQKFGGRKPGGSKAQINLRNTILEVLQSLDAHEYLRKVALKDPRTYCTLLSRILPLQVAGDPNNPISYAVTLRFGGTDGEEHAIELPTVTRPALTNNAPDTEHQVIDAEVVEDEPSKLH